MRHLTLALATSAMLAFPAGAQETATTAETTEGAPAAEAVVYDASTVVARVNDRDITVGHMIAIMERLPEQYQSMENDVLFPGILDQLIDQVIIADTVSASPETDSPRVALIMENERLALLAKQAIDGIVAQGVDEAAILAAYEAQFANLPTKAEYNASHILVETADEAQAVITEINGGADFAEVAKSKSTGPSGPNGGELGWFGEGVMVPEFQTAVLALEVGAISEPVQTQFGWHVIKLNETRDVPPPALEEVREDLTNKLLQSKVGSEIDKIRAEAKIERIEIDLPKDAIRNFGLIDVAK